jgi:glycosyltransferase involved in cell wall biosynthesis
MVEGAVRRPSFTISMPSRPDVEGTGQAMTVADGLRHAGWEVSAITLRSDQVRVGLETRMVDISTFERVAPLTPLRFREDWMLNLGYEAFDRLAARLVEPADVFYGLSHSCLHSLRKARRLGALTVMCACNTFMPVMKELVEAEYRALGYQHPLINSAAVRRVLAEYKEADLIRVESTLVQASLIDGGIAPEKIFLLPPSIDLDSFTRPLREPDEFCVAFVGAFSIRKGLHHLLHGWDLLRPRARGRLVLHGGGGGWSKRLLAPYRDRPDVEFRVGLPHATYRDASVCVVPSIEDGFCRVVLEAMASGVPVIITDRVGAKDLVTDGCEGYIVPAGDPGAIAERISHLQSHPVVRDRMARAAYARTRGHSTQEEGRRLSALLHGALGGRSEAP